MCKVGQLHTGDFNRVFKKDNREQEISPCTPEISSKSAILCRLGPVQCQSSCARRSFNPKMLLRMSYNLLYGGTHKFSLDNAYLVLPTMSKRVLQKVRAIALPPTIQHSCSKNYRNIQRYCNMVVLESKRTKPNILGIERKSILSKVCWTFSKYPHPFSPKHPMKIDAIFSIIRKFHTIALLHIKRQMGASDISKVLFHDQTQQRQTSH